jgi:PAS domain S-box-containing protein
MGTDTNAGDDDPQEAVEPIRVLCVDDEPSVDAVSTYAREEEPYISVVSATTARGAVETIHREPIDCTVSGYELPDLDGITLHDRLRDEGFDGSFLLYTDRPEAVASDAFAAGVDDVVKTAETDGYKFLFDKVRGAVTDASDGTATHLDGEPVEVSTVVALVDDLGETAWADGSLPDSTGVDRDHFYETVADVLSDDEAFRRQVTDADGEVGPRHWSLADDGAVEHHGYSLPERFEADRLEVLREVSREYELRSRLDRFERLLDTASDGLYALNENGRYTYVNETMTETLGYEREELLGMHAEKILGDEYGRGQDHVRELVADSDRESEVLEMEVLQADGSTLPVAISYTPLYGETGGYKGLVGVMRDVSRRKERERKLHESERRYRTLAENIPNGGVAMFDETLRYTLAAGEIFDRMEVDPDDFEDERIEDIHTAEFVERYRSEYEAVFDGEREIIEFRHSGRDLRAHLVPLEDPDSNISSGLILVVDITDQREYERKLERQNERLEEFASIVSHDLRNPLNVIGGRLDLYQKDGDEEHLERAQNSVEYMQSLIDDLLHLAQQGQMVGEIEPVDLDALLESCWENVGTGDATLRRAGELGEIQADRGRLKQLIENVIRNSVEHGSTSSGTGADGAGESAGESVTVTAGPLPDGFYLEDDGPGIPPSVRDSLFEYGATTANDGTGIGLAIVAEIAEAHGWSVTATESESGGARFEITGVERP